MKGEHRISGGWGGGEIPSKNFNPLPNTPTPPEVYFLREGGVEKFLVNKN